MNILVIPQPEEKKQEEAQPLLYEAAPLEQPVEEVVNTDLPPISEMIGSKFAVVVGFILVPIVWLIALPFRSFTRIIVKIKTKRYDPEKIICPACGFRGDAGTNGKTCTVIFILTKGHERGAIQHQCFRCGCDKIFSHLFSPADKWLGR